jgi:hypothetical protein
MVELNALAARADGRTVDTADAVFGFLRGGLDAVRK